jgi:hypothetical protein
MDLNSTIGKVDSVLNIPSKIDKAVDTFSGITGAIDKFGVSNLGLGAGNVSYAADVAGGLPWQTAGTPVADLGAGLPGTQVAGGLGEYLGAAGFGWAAGGYLGKLVGGNPTGGSIGGALGGIAGNALIGSSLSTGLGTALGAAGSLLPGVGTVIGTVAGSLIGSAFGGGTPHPWSMFKGGTISADGSIQNSFITNKHIKKDFGQQTQTELQQFLKDQSQKYGITYKDGLAVYGGFRDKKGNVGISSQEDFWNTKMYNNSYIKKNAPNDTYFHEKFDPKDKAAKQAAYQKIFEFAAKASGYNVADLKPVQSNNGNVINQYNTRESPFDKFLANYREKQNANLA